VATRRGGALLFTALVCVTPADARGQDTGSIGACYQSQLLLGRALADSIEVDRGAAFRTLSPSPETVLGGQKFVIERAVPSLPSDTVVLVRWTPSPDSPPFWSDRREDAVEPGARRVAMGVVREPEHWAGGLPTLDFLGDVYPEPPNPRRAQADTSGGVMTVDEYFDFCSMEVDLALVGAGDWSRDIEPMAWARRSGGAWRRYPAFSHLYSWARRIELARILAAPVDVGGTYAAELELPSGRRLAFSFRTSSKAEYPLTRRTPAGPSIAPWEFRELGYRVRFWIALEGGELPLVQGDPFTPPCLFAGWTPSPARRSLLPNGRLFPLPSEEMDQSCFRATRPWEVRVPTEAGDPRLGVIYPEMLTDIFPDDEEISALIELYHSRVPERYNAGEELPTPGRFSTAPTGAIEFRQTIEAEPGRVARISAVRTSEEAVLEVAR